MVSTLSSYLQITNNETKWQNLTAAEPEVKAQTAYYEAHIGDVKTPADLVNNYQLFSYVLTAYGLGDQTYAKALFQKVLEQGTGSTSDLAYTLNNPNILSLAQTFNFAANGASTTSSSAVLSDVVSKYTEQQLESDQAQSDPGVQLALYFQQHASSITSIYNILADKNLLTVVQTALGLSSYTSEEPIDTQEKLISNQLNVADFQDPKKLQSFIEKFCAMYDINNPNATSSQNSDAPDILLNNGSSSSGSGGFSSSLLNSMQGVNFSGL